MRNYLKAFSEVFDSGHIKDDSIVQHIHQQAMIDKILPENASFFYVIEIPTLKYHFLGKQQVNVSGYSNEEFIERGIDLFFQSVHPDDVDIILNEIYPTYIDSVMKHPPEDRKKIQFQYNYRFKRRDGVYVNLLEQVHLLEVDESGRPALLLGNVTILDNKDILPVRLSIKHISDSGFTEIYLSKKYQSYPSKFENITNRELDILRNLAVGKTSKEIGQELYISSHTVDTHRRNLLRKLECKSVVELALIAFENGLL